MPSTLAKKRARMPGVGRSPLAMAEARKQLPKLADALEKHPEIGAVKITRRGKPVLAVLSWDLYESVVETMEIMSDPGGYRSVRAVGQRYRIIYRVERTLVTVVVVAAGIRKAGSREDIYRVAAK